MDSMTIRIHREKLPQSVHGAVTQDGTCYTIILNADSTPAQQLAAFLHEMTHIYNNNLAEGGDAKEVEEQTHRQLLEALEELREIGGHHDEILRSKRRPDGRNI